MNTLIHIILFHYECAWVIIKFLNKMLENYKTKVVLCSGIAAIFCYLYIESNVHFHIQQPPHHFQREELADVYLVNNVSEMILKLCSPIQKNNVAKLHQTLQTTPYETLFQFYHEIKEFESPYLSETCLDSRIPPKTCLPKSVHLPDSSGLWNGYTVPVISVSPGGRLGNLMGEYATLYALSKIYDVTVIINPLHRQKMMGCFPHLSISAYREERTLTWTTMTGDSRNGYNSMQLASAGLLGPYAFKVDGFPFEKHLFSSYKEEIQREFTFDSDLIKNAQDFLYSTQTNVNYTRTSFVSVHVRLTDYAYHLKVIFGIKNISFKNYLRKAIRYFEQKLENVVFIIVSDDLNSVKSFLPEKDNMVYYTGNTGEQDLALMTQCNHSIITVGSYGFWGAFLKSNPDALTIYPDLSPYNDDYPFSKLSYERAGLQNFISLSI